MRRLSFLGLVTFLSLLNLQAQPLTRKVLFIGNSYTGVNNLPLLTANAAASVGDNLIYDSNLPGGSRLIDHFNDPNSTNKIMVAGWNYVVLQEQSVTPALQNGNFTLGTKQLCNLIKQYNACAQPLLYMTWGRKNGDPLNCPLFPLMCTYNSMDSLTHTSYTMEAASNNAEVSPVGAVWNYLRQNHPTLELYQADESHPSDIGSYAAAICFYTAIFKKNPLLVSYNYVLSPANAAIIRSAVKNVFFDHLSSWDFKVPPTANFNYSIGPGINEAVFNYLPSYSGTGPYANSFLWTFGDGTTLALTNPNYLSTVSHTYATNGTYTVTLTVSNCDPSGSQQATYQTTVSFCNHSPTVFRTYPWVCAAQDTVSTQVYSAYQWYSFGNLIPGATGQKMPLDPLLPHLSVLATQNGCSEMSPVYIHVSNPGFFSYDINPVGNFIRPDTVCNGQAIKLIVTELDGTESIQWSKNGSPLTQGTNDTLLVTASGSYAVKLFHYNCPDYIFYTKQLSYTFVDCSVATGITGVNGHASIAVHPNPAPGIITVSSTEKINAIAIFNLLGEKVHETLYEQGQTSDKFDLSNCPAGVYFVKVNSGKTFITKKIVLQ